MTHYVRVAPLEALPEGELRAVELGGLRVVLARANGEVHAYPDRCPHKGIPLSQGKLSGTVLTCSAHQWTFDACSGAAIDPKRRDLVRLPVKIEDDAIWVAICP